MNPYASLHRANVCTVFRIPATAAWNHTTLVRMKAPICTQHMGVFATLETTGLDHTVSVWTIGLYVYVARSGRKDTDVSFQCYSCVRNMAETKPTLRTLIAFAVLPHISHILRAFINISWFNTGRCRTATTPLIVTWTVWLVESGPGAPTFYSPSDTSTPPLLTPGNWHTIRSNAITVMRLAGSQCRLLHGRSTVASENVDRVYCGQFVCTVWQELVSLRQCICHWLSVLPASDFLSGKQEGGSGEPNNTLLS
jgi:hypothetical protein